MSDFNAVSGVSLFDGKPFVEIKTSENVQKMRPDKAREIGMMLIESAVEAERDAALVYGVKNTLHMQDTDAARILTMIRENRDQFAGLE